MASNTKFYKVVGDSKENIGSVVPLRFKGSTIDVNIVGSQGLPTALSDMTTILTANLDSTTWYEFSSLPKYIAFTGTFDSFEIQNYFLTEIGEIA